MTATVVTPDGTAVNGTPSSNLMGNLRAELVRRQPFSQMAAADLDRLLAAGSQVYYAPGEVILAPDSGPVRQLLLLRSGRVTGRLGLAESAGGFEYEPGDLFPIGALMGARPVTSTYEADGDCFCLAIPAEAVQAVAAASPPFADHLNRRMGQYLELSRQALQAAYSSQALAEQSLEKPLGSLPRKQPVAVGPQAPLREALTQMHDRRVGSVMVVDESGAALGILTRYDILGRVTLPQRPLDTPIAEVMTHPVYTLTVDDTAQQAALLMSRHGLRHVPITDGGRVVSIVSERDLFALQRLSLKQISTTIRAAEDLATLQQRAGEIRRFARHLLAQGVQARQLTELISHLNDLIAERLVQLVAARRGLDLDRCCWVAFGSEGRGEQTIATDQDNGLIFDSDDPERDRPAWLDFAREVNEGLDACGYPLCKGNVMASNPQCCLTPAEWRARFAAWMDAGAPQDLLNASIYFDLRAVAGRTSMAEPLRAFITGQAAQLPRFIKQLVDNSLAQRPPLNWRGGIETHEVDGREVIDLKHQGTAIVVDAARILALAQGVSEVSTRGRLEAAGRALKVEPAERESWIGAFEYLQMLRLEVQLPSDPNAPPPAQPNLIEVATLSDIDRRVLKESLRFVRRLQQRLELDYQR
jgi:CBS domain-containing protein